MDRQKILTFLAFTFGLGILAAYLPKMFFDPQSMIFPFVGPIAFAWTPALAAILTQQWVYKGSMAKYGWNRKRYSFRWIGLTILVPFVLVLGSLGVVFLLGNVFRIPGFGEVITQTIDPEWIAQFPPVYKMDFMNQWLLQRMGVDSMHVIQAQGLPSEIASLLIMLTVIGLIAGLTVGMIYTVGEEVGWRGFMLTETRSMGFIESNFILGGLWGLWNLIPYTVYNDLTLFPLSDMIWEMLAIVGFCVAMSFPLAWLAQRTRSIYASATVTSILNNVGAMGMIFLYDGHSLLTSSTGLAGMMVLLLATFFIIRFDKKFVNDYPNLFY
ncbi:MAG: CPBP family glutamic-type intramembrane protease [Bacteroidota bacterium]